MAVNLRTSGAESLSELSAKLKKLQRGDLRRELLRGLRTGAAPLVGAARQSALETLPKEGGLNQVVAGTKVVVRSRLSGASARVRLEGHSPHRTKAMDQGRVRHPVYGNRDNWVTQQVTPGWWTKPMEEGAPHVRAALVNVVNEISRKL